MKNILSNIIYFISLFLIVAFSSCEEASVDLDKELTIQQKVALLESNEWLPKGLEENVMHTFSNGKQFTFYGENNVFSDSAILGTEDYIIDGDSLTFDFHFGHVYTYEIVVSCNQKIIDFFRDGELNKTLYKRNSNYLECL